jgi:hypothetical protein
MERMNTAIHKAARNFAWLLVCATLGSSASGCELVADFDRSKIPMGGTPGLDAGNVDAGLDATIDADVSDDAGDLDDAGATDASDVDDAGDDSDGG